MDITALSKDSLLQQQQPIDNESSLAAALSHKNALSLAPVVDDGELGGLASINQTSRGIVYILAK
jgi:hypothetical protein